MKSFITVRRNKRKKIQFLTPLFGGVRFAVIDMNYYALFFSLKPDSILHSREKKNFSRRLPNTMMYDYSFHRYDILT